MRGETRSLSLSLSKDHLPCNYFPKNLYGSNTVFLYNCGGIDALFDFV